MKEVSHQRPSRKFRVRVHQLADIGVRRRRPWLKPFSVAVFRVERIALGVR